MMFKNLHSLLPSARVLPQKARVGHRKPLLSWNLCGPALSLLLCLEEAGFKEWAMVQVQT